MLEIGCGEGQWLGSFRAFGADEGQLCGIELDDGRASVARARYPGCDVRTGDAAALPWESGSFDVVFQSTVFSSILDDALLANVAREMARVLRPGGRVLSYDFAWDNPRNRAVRGIGRRRLAALFPGFRLHAARVTLAPPLARQLVPRSVTVSSVLESLRLLNTHLFATLTPP